MYYKYQHSRKQQARPTIYTTKNIERAHGKFFFQTILSRPFLVFDDDGRAYLIYGVAKTQAGELNADDQVKPGASEQEVIIENASAPAGIHIGLNAEVLNPFKVNGKYYLFNIVWSVEECAPL
jgi:hypothetical protein